MVSMPQESRNAIKQAEGTNHFVVFVFLFLPISIITSLFGMNVRRFGRGFCRFGYHLLSFSHYGTGILGLALLLGKLVVLVKK